jgi:hypothetical protein
LLNLPLVLTPAEAEFTIGALAIASKHAPNLGVEVGLPLLNRLRLAAESIENSLSDEVVQAIQDAYERAGEKAMQEFAEGLKERLASAGVEVVDETEAGSVVGPSEGGDTTLN